MPSDAATVGTRLSLKTEAHAALAGRALRLVARDASDPLYRGLVVGSLVDGMDVLGFRSQSRVSTVTVFASFGDAWEYYRSLGRETALLPTEWIHSVGRSVVDGSEAQAFYETLGPRASVVEAPRSKAVRVFGLELVSCDPALRAAYQRLCGYDATRVRLVSRSSHVMAFRRRARDGPVEMLALELGGGELGLPGAAARSDEHDAVHAARRALSDVSTGSSAVFPVTARPRWRDVRYDRGRCETAYFVVPTVPAALAATEGARWVDVSDASVLSLFGRVAPRLAAARETNKKVIALNVASR